MKKSLQKWLIYLSVLILISGLSYSQSRNTGAIEGRIVDSEGVSLPGAEVKLSSPDMIGGIQSKISDASGRFRFVGLFPGVYTVEAILEGFVTVKREEIRLSTGQTLTVAIELQIATLAEEVTVIGVSPIIDVKDSAVGITNWDKDFLDNIPNVERRASRMISQAPGVWGLQAFGGSSRRANQYMLDGLDTGFIKSGSDWAVIDFNIMDEIQMIGLGVGAEYDGFSGIIQNSTTKSGGNKFEGHVEFFYQDWDWYSGNFDPNEPKFSLYQDPPKSRDIDMAFTIGGPFIRDKLWFFFAIRWPRQQQEIPGMDEIYSTEIPTIFIKLTSQLSQRLRMSFWFEHDVYYNKNKGLSIVRPPDTTFIEDGFSNLFTLSSLYAFSDRSFLEVKAHVAIIPYWNEPKRGYNLPGRIDDLTGIYSVNTRGWYDSTANRYVLSSILSHHADEFIKGSHDFKFGLDIETAASWDEYRYCGGYFYRDNVWDGEQYATYAYQYGYYNEQTFARISVFVQDSWKISDRLVINPGLRFNWYKGWIDPVSFLSHRGWVGPPEEGGSIFSANAFVPRLGFTWDIFGDHSTAFKVHYGRYAAGMKQNYFIEAGKGIEDWVIYKVMPNGSKMETFRMNYSNPATVDPDIKFPFMDQFTLGIERELMKDTSVGVTFIWRKWSNMIARVNTGATWEKVPFTFTDENGV